MNSYFASKAKEFAKRAHEGQTRKDGSTPFVLHPLRVAQRLHDDYGVTDPHTLAAAYLHDVVEDTVTTVEQLIEEFDPRLGDFVDQLTRTEDQSRREYLESFRDAHRSVLLVKLVDRLDNLQDWEGMDEGFRRDYAREGLLLVQIALERDLYLGSAACRALRDLFLECLKYAPSR